MAPGFVLVGDTAGWFRDPFDRFGISSCPGPSRCDQFIVPEVRCIRVSARMLQCRKRRRTQADAGIRR